MINLQEEDADDYTCVAVNAGGVSEQNVSLTFDTPALEPNREEPAEKEPHFSTLITAVVGGRQYRKSVRKTSLPGQNTSITPSPVCLCTSCEAENCHFCPSPSLI